MKKILLVLVLLGLALSVVNIFAYPSGNKWPPEFEYRNGAWHDKPWDINRNAWYGTDGYLPNLEYESLGNYTDLAYSWGEGFKQDYPNRVQCAEAILSFVQRWTEYGYDKDYVTRDGQPQVEWAWNPDEMAYMIRQARDAGTIARGDCEDLAFLCGALYLGAGFDVTIVAMPGHVALLIWFPDYPNANIYWDILDGRGYGWIWVESTGHNNPLGWTPPQYDDGNFNAYPIQPVMPTSITVSNIRYSPIHPIAQDDVSITASVTHNQSDIVEVNLIYSVKGGAQNSTLPMSFIGNLTYAGTIPKQGAGSEISFYVQAKDGIKTAESITVTYKVTKTIFGLPENEFYLLVFFVFIVLLLTAVVGVAGRKK